MKMKKGLLAVIVLVVLAFSVLSPHVELAWIQFRDSVDSNYAKEVQKEWANKSTDFLISKLGHASYIFDGAAVANLTKRQLSAGQVEKLKYNINQSRHPRKAVSSLSVLFAIDEGQAISIALNILREGEANPLYKDALLQLAHIRNPDAFVYLIEYAKKPDGYNNGSVNMLKHYGRPDAIPVLEDMLNKINEKDSFVRALLQSTIQEAIKSLKK